MTILEQTHRLEARVRDECARLGPAEAYRRLIAENDEAIRGANLDNGGQIVAARSAIHTELVRHWAAAQHAKYGLDRPFAVVAVGGTGRGEVTPCSDLDFAYLFDEPIENNAFFEDLRTQTVNEEEAFQAAYGFSFEASAFNLDHPPLLKDEQLNSFLDLRPIHDPHGLAARFRERIRATYDPFEHFLHVRGFWNQKWAEAAAAFERVSKFDIKNEGLRVFLAGIWMLGGRQFRHSHEVYAGLEDTRDLEAYQFLLRIRCFVHLRHPNREASGPRGIHPQDVLRFEDLLHFHEMLGPDVDARTEVQFGDEVRARLLAARRRVARFATSVLQNELYRGREVAPGSPIALMLGGLRHQTSPGCCTPEEKSSAALALLLASQRYREPIDPIELQTTFRRIADWLVPVPELGALFYDPQGSLAATFEFLARFEGAEARLFPGYDQFEASLDERVMTQRNALRGTLLRQKLKELEDMLAEGRPKVEEAVRLGRAAERPAQVDRAFEAAALSPAHLAAVRLALKTKRLPLTSDDLVVRQDTTRPEYERYASGLSGTPLSEYYVRYRKGCGFTEETLRMTEFLVAHRRAFREWADDGVVPDTVADEFAELCGDESNLRALYVFTCADRAEWHGEGSEPDRWFSTRELYEKAQKRFHPSAEPDDVLARLGFSREEQAILRDLGPDFFNGGYRSHARTFGAHLLRLVEHPERTGPSAKVLPEGLGCVVGVAARDFRGLAACITGAFWKYGVGLRQAHLFTAATYELVLDFFHPIPGGAGCTPDLRVAIESAIREQKYIGESDEAALPSLKGETTLQEWIPGKYRLRHQSTRDEAGIVYALCYRVYRHLRANIFALKAHAGRRQAYVSIFLNLPPDMTLEEARGLVAEHFA